jgi:hypothetical protein
MFMLNLLAQATDEAQVSADAAAAAAVGTAGAAVAGVMLVVWIVVILLSVVGLILWIWAIIDVSKRQFANPSDKTTWLIVLIVGFVIGLSWLAAIIYLVAGRKKGTMPGQTGGPSPASQA